MPKTSDVRRHWWLLPQWPEQDRTLWLARTAPCHALDIPHYGQRLSLASLASIERAYGRYLCFLDQTDQLDPLAGPASRVSPRLVGAFLRHLRELDYMPQTLVVALSGVRSAVRIMAPELDTSWIWQPDGVPISGWLRGRRKTFDVPRTAELFQWGVTLMDESGRLAGHHAWVAYRDGLMIALLAARPLRRRTFAGLKIGEHLVKADGYWHLQLAPADMKNRRALEFDVPAMLQSRVDRYLTEIRPRLLRGPDTDAMWIAAHGRPMALTAVGLMIRVRALKRFGVEFGPHRFRHALGTTAPIVDPANPGVAASVLGIGARMVEMHYNRAENHVAADGLRDALEAERASLAPLARRLFERR